MNKQPIKANQALNSQPKMGNLISQEYAGPLIASLVISIIAGLWGISIGYCLGFWLWSSGGWLLWAGKKPYLNIAKLTKKKPNWVTARIKYQSKENIPLRKK